MPRFDSLRASGMLRVDERQRQERAAVLRPLREGGQARRGRGASSTTSGTGASPRARRPDAQGGAEERPERPELLAPSAGGAPSRPAPPSSTNSRGFAPNASSRRFFVPKRFVTTGKSAPFGRLKRSAGPPASITRRWISGISSRGSTSASTTARSFSLRSASRKARRSFRRTCPSRRRGRECSAAPRRCGPRRARSRSPPRATRGGGPRR